MTGALPDDQPARVVRFEGRDRTVISDLGGRDGQAEQDTKRKKREREEKKEKWLKNAYWLIFCCGLCERWDLAADSHPPRVQNSGSRDGQRR